MEQPKKSKKNRKNRKERVSTPGTAPKGIILSVYSVDDGNIRLGLVACVSVSVRRVGLCFCCFGGLSLLDYQGAVDAVGTGRCRLSNRQIAARSASRKAVLMSFNISLRWCLCLSAYSRRGGQTKSDGNGCQVVRRYDAK